MKFDSTLLYGNSILHLFYFEHFFDPTHRLRDIESFLENNFPKNASPMYYGIIMEIYVPQQIISLLVCL